MNLSNATATFERISLRLSVFLSLLGATAAHAEQEIADVRVGYRQLVKPGYWVPIAVDLRSKNEPFRGNLEFDSSDNDNLSTTLTVPVFVEKDGSETIHRYVKMGGDGGTVGIRLRDPNTFRTVANYTVELTNPALNIDTLDADEKLILAFGNPAGLFELNQREQQTTGNAQQELRSAVTRSLLAQELPTQWFAYGPATSVVLATSDPSFSELDPLRVSALRTWVRQGGHLIVSGANNWQVLAKSFVGPMLPADLTGVDRLRAPEGIESYAQANVRLNVGDEGIAVAKLGPIRGKVIHRQGDYPLLVSGSYGLGVVTLLTFDTDVAPFSKWDGRKNFWVRLLDLKNEMIDDPVAQQQQRMRMVRGYGITDLSSMLHLKLEEFPDVKVIPFGGVALLILAYILLIGPVDYLFLKKVVGRLELTWITFPTWVIVISVAAYFAAHWLKGDELRINRVEIVDIDPASNTLRGTSFLSIFSPQIAKYKVAVEPELAAGGTWESLGMGRDQSDRLMSWLGTSEDAFRGMYGGGGSGLLGRRGYQYFDATTNARPMALVDVPIRVWSVKNFMSRWLAKSAPSIEANLKGDDIFLTGTITNKLDKPLTDVIVAYGERVFEVSRLEPNQSFDMASARGRGLKDFLGKRGLTGANEYRIEPDKAVDLKDLVHVLMLTNATPDSFRSFPNHYFFDLDFSDRLTLGKAILIAKVDGATGGKLWLNTLPSEAAEAPAIDAKTRTDTFVRVVLEPTRT